MNNFYLTANVVLPIFLVMACGYLCRRLGVVDEKGVSTLNKLVFNVFLPASLCSSMISAEGGIVSPYALLFASVGTLFVFVLAMLIVPRFEGENRRRGVMIQGIFRSNYAILGIPVAEALFPNGDGGVAAMMVIATVPLYNMLGVVALEAFRGSKANLGKIMLGILKNPLIWGCLIGLLIGQMHIALPTVLSATLQKIAVMASPLALFALGASISLRAFRGNGHSLTITVLARLVLVPLALLSIAYFSGFRGAEFVALMIAFASPCSVSSYTMAVQMGGDGDLAAQQIATSTVLSSVTIFLMILLFKNMGIF